VVQHSTSVQGLIKLTTYFARAANHNLSVSIRNTPYLHSVVAIRVPTYKNFLMIALFNLFSYLPSQNKAWIFQQRIGNSICTISLEMN